MKSAKTWNPLYQPHVGVQYNLNCDKPTRTIQLLQCRYTWLPYNRTRAIVTNDVSGCSTCANHNPGLVALANGSFGGSTFALTSSSFTNPGKVGASVLFVPSFGVVAVLTTLFTCPSPCAVGFLAPLSEQHWCWYCGPWLQWVCPQWLRPRVFIRGCNTDGRVRFSGLDRPSKVLPLCCIRGRHAVRTMRGQRGWVRRTVPCSWSRRRRDVHVR